MGTQISRFYQLRCSSVPLKTILIHGGRVADCSSMWKGERCPFKDMAPKLLTCLVTFHWPKLGYKPHLAAEDSGKYGGWLGSHVLGLKLWSFILRKCRKKCRKNMEGGKMSCYFFQSWFEKSWTFIFPHKLWNEFVDFFEKSSKILFLLFNLQMTMEFVNIFPMLTHLICGYRISLSFQIF